MKLIDWRELYAANRAVIEGRRAPGHDMLRLRGRGEDTLSPDRLGEEAFRPAILPGRTAGGTWRRIEYRDGRRARPVAVYTPARIGTATAAPLVIALHGCTQTAATFAAGSLLNRAADRHGFVVAYPEQSRDDNPQGCWNWFSASHQARGGGEPAFIAGATRAVLEEAMRSTVDTRRVFVAGMSAGGAMAAVMGATYPDLFAAVAVHSGLAYGCAAGLPAATAAMAHGGPDPEAQGRAAFAAMGAFARPVPAIVIHGTADRVVCPVNGEHAVRQWMVTNRLAAAGAYEPRFSRPDATVRETAAGGHACTRRTWNDRAGRLVQEYLEVEGLGHAWSGGARGGSHADPRGPSAAEAIWDFFARV